MAHQNLLIAINGTHDYTFDTMPPDEYDENFKGSHVQRIFQYSTCDQSLYVRGPNGSAKGVSSGLNSALDFIWKVQQSGYDSLALYLFGFSRGAAMCLELANWLSSSATVQVGAWSPKERHGAATNRINRKNIRIRVLGMFDAVDMALDMGCDPVHAAIERSVLIRRAGWHSRDGWTNVGDSNAPGAALNAVRKRWPLIGTHGAMGGQPANGDVPIPLAKELLKAMGSSKLPRNQLNWTKATIRARQFASAGGMKQLLAKDKKDIASAEKLFMTNVNERDKFNKSFQGPRSGASDYESNFEGMMQDYANQKYILNSYGGQQTLMNEALGGFPGIIYSFQDIPICVGIVNRYIALDRRASANALTLMKAGLGDFFPAKL